VKIALSEISTVAASFADDVAAYRAAGFDGIGIWEFKLPDGDDDASARLVRESGLGVANCVPAIPTGVGDVGVMVDTVHLWDTPALAEEVERHAARITGFHVGDKAAASEPSRLLPGEGVTHPEELARMLRATGFDDYLDVEIFSTPDAFWGLPVDEAARRAAAAARWLIAQS
jgi:sugar phosphate isomerase/epimerase